MKRISVLIATIATYFSLANFAFANIQVDPCPATGTGGGFQNLCNLRVGGGLFQTLITSAFIVASLIALAFLIYGGIRWITSGGDKSAVESARNIIVAALVGLVITFLAYLIITFVFNFFGLNFGQFTFPSLNVAPNQ
jgi:hypothetical protein